MSQSKVAIVTGGGQGIGKAIAKTFLEAGIKVVIAEIDPEAGKETESEYSATGQVKFIPTNIANEADVQKTVAQTVDTFGRLDILVNNAALANPENEPITQLSLGSWNQVMSVNLTGAFLCSKYAIPHLQANGGTIINISSTRALMSESNTEAYSTAKGGLVALTHALANSFGPAIRVNSISPGWIVTSNWQQAAKAPPPLTPEDHQQHPAGRAGKPDVAAMALYLASESAAFITGANFVVDGGMSRKMIYV